jgi:hypothetical protein
MMRTTVVLGLGILAGLNSVALADDLPVKLTSITAQVHPGGVVILVVHTQAGAVCEGKRQGHFGDSYSIVLPSQSAGPDGLVHWKWSVLGGNHPIGVRGVHVSCTAADRAGSLDTSFNVQ